MLHLLSRRAWKQSQSLGRFEGEVSPPVPATMPSSRKRKRSPSPQPEPEAPSTSKRDKRGRISKIVEEPEPEEEEVQQPEVKARPSRNRRKSAKALEIQEESASTASEKETETPPSTSRRKSGRVDKNKDEEKGKETETKKARKEEVVAPLTVVTSKGKKGKTSIRIKPIVEPKDDEEIVERAPEKESRSSRKKKKSGKHDLEPLPPLDIPSDSNITVREDQESGIKLKLILSPKDRTQAEIAHDEQPSTEERKKSKRDRGKKGKDKGRKAEAPSSPAPTSKEDKLRAKLVFKDQVLSLDGDTVTHTEKVQASDDVATDRSKSRSKSKKRKHEEVESPVVEEHESREKKKADKSEEVEEMKTPKTDRKSKKKKGGKELVEKHASPPVEEFTFTEKSNTPTSSSKSSKSKGHKDKRKGKHGKKGSKDEVKGHESDVKSHEDEMKGFKMDANDDDVAKLEKKDKKKKKLKKARDSSRGDLDMSHGSMDSYEDTDASLVIDESPGTSKGHSSKRKLMMSAEKKESSKESSHSSEGERKKEKSKHKHHRHDKHHRSDKKSKHRKHHSDGSRPAFEVFSSPNASDTSYDDLSTINASGLGFTGISQPAPISDGHLHEKKKKLSSSKHKKGNENRDGKGHTKGKDGDKSLKKEEKEKKPLSAYMLWCIETRPSVVKENPHANFSAISKLMGFKWHQLTEKDKAYWQNMARKQTVKHKNIPTLSANKISSRSSSGHSGKPKPRSPSKLQPPNMEAIDIAAHLRLLGESLSTVGSRLQEHKGEIEIHGSVSVLLDSTLCALGPLMALTSQVPEINGCSRDTHVSTLENIAYIMPGL